MLMEQPCAAHDWKANAAVAGVSRVPLMLDESITSIADIERAATITNIGYVKIKLKLGTDIVRRGQVGGLRFSGLVTVGNSADVDPNDLLAFQTLTPRADRPTRRVVMFGNGGGTSVLATDFFSHLGLDVTPFDPPALDALAALQRHEWFVNRRTM